MNYFDWLYKTAPKPEKVTGDLKAEDDPKHMEHCHPNGFDPKTDHCVLVDRDKAIDGVSSKESPHSKDSPHHYEQYSKGVSQPEMEKWIKENCGGNTKCVYARSEEDFIADGIAKEINSQFIGFGEFPSRKDYENSCRIFYEIGNNLKSRFPNIPLDLDWYIPFNFNRKKLGSSTLDRRQDISYIGVLAHPENIKKIGYQKNEDFDSLIYAITRHEIGHNLSTYDVLGESISIIDSLRDRIGSKELFRILYEKVSPYSSFLELNLILGKCNRFSLAYNKEMDETVAEIFSTYTSPTYKEGTMPKELESIAIKMITKPVHQEKGKVVMDSIEGDDLTYAERHPAEWEEFIKYNSIQYQQGSTKYGYWDIHTDRWVPMAEDSLWARMIRAVEERNEEELDKVIAECEKARKEKEH